MPSCRVRHIVARKVIQALVFDKDGKSVPYDRHVPSGTLNVLIVIPQTRTRIPGTFPI